MPNVLCVQCLKSVGEMGAFLPSEGEGDLVCVNCFHAAVGHEPLHEATAHDDLVMRSGVFHRPALGTRPGKGEVLYHQVVVNSATRQIIRKITKKNILALKNLPPGDYSMSYRVG